jgi:hypothetical protein
MCGVYKTHPATPIPPFVRKRKTTKKFFYFFLKGQGNRRKEEDLTERTIISDTDFAK